MKILILTQYFPPETGAPQNRLYSLATHLANKGAEITVVTANPSYPISSLYAGYESNGFSKEKMGQLSIQRCPIFVTKSKKIIPRLLNYFSFVFTSMWICLFRLKKQDLLICESPPLFLGITALMTKWFRGSKLIFNVSDLWPKTAEELGIISNKAMLGISYALERLLYNQSALVSGQTQGIVDDIKQRYPSIPLFLLRNGIDVIQFSRTGDREKFRNQFQISPDKFVITYAGIIGHAQGFDVVLDAAEKLKINTDIVFMLVGDGPLKTKLQDEVSTRKITNVIFAPSVPRDQMPDVIAGCDCYVTPLRKSSIFLGAIPSKIFEPLYYGKPALLGVNGEAKALFVDEGKCALHFEPDQPNELVEQIIRLKNDPVLLKQLGENGREYVLNKFNRSTIADAFWERIKLL